MSRPSTHAGFRRLLDRDNLEHCEVATLIGVSHTHLSNYLAGRVSGGTRRRIEPLLAALFFAGDQVKLRRALRMTKFQVPSSRFQVRSGVK